MSKKGNAHTGYRSNSTGKFVTVKHGKSSPSTTTKEAIPNPGRGDTGRGKR